MNLVSLIVLSLLAQAAGLTTAKPEAKAKAQVLVGEGADLYQAGAFAAALEKWSQAYAIFPSPKILFNIGQANREVGRMVEAVEAFEKFLAKAPDAAPDLLAEARHWRDELSPKLGKLFVDCNLDGTEIALDGKTIGKSPLSGFVRVSPGSHQVTATHPAAFPAVKTVTIAGGDLLTTGIVMQGRSELAPPAGMAISTPAPPVGVEVESRRSEPAHESGWLLGRKWTWVAAGATVVFVGVAAGAGMSMQSEFDSLSKSCGQVVGGCSADQRSGLDLRRDIANVFWGLSAAAAVTTGVLFFVEGRPVAVAPMAGAGTGFVASVRY
jgi:hypothetical protein